MHYTMGAAAAVQHLALTNQQHSALPAGMSAQGSLQLVSVSQAPAQQQGAPPVAGQMEPLPPDPHTCFTTRQLQILADHGISTADLQGMLLTAAQHPQAAPSTAQAGAAAQTAVLQAKGHGSCSSSKQAPAGAILDSSAQPHKPGACMNNLQGDFHVHVELAPAHTAAAAPGKVLPNSKQPGLSASEVDTLGALRGFGIPAQRPQQSPAGPHAAALAAMFLQSISTAAQAAIKSRSREPAQDHKSAQHASSQQLDLDLTLLNNSSDFNSTDDIDSPMSVMALQAYQAILNMAAYQAPLPDQVSTPSAGKPPAGPSNSKKRSQPSFSPEGVTACWKGPCGFGASAAAGAGLDHLQQYDDALTGAAAGSGTAAYSARRKVIKKSQTGSTAGAGTACACNSPLGQSIFPPTERWMREVRENIPVDMQEVIRSDWLAKEPQELYVTCNGISAVFFVDAISQRCKIRTQDGREITPNEFEAECGLQNSKAWMQSILVTEYALIVHGYSHYSGGLYTKRNLCLGHFTRIVNIDTSGGNSRQKR